MLTFQQPVSEEFVRSLKCGDSLLYNGVLYTARDAAHKHFASGANPVPGLDLQGGLIYHCGPVTVKTANGWAVTAAGPTTSIREEPYMATLIRRFGLRGIIGKGGMGEGTAQACRECGCVYLHAVGGAARLLARCVDSVLDVFYYEEFGAPEAIWKLQVTDFPVIVTMDSTGRSLHQEVLQTSRRQFEAFVPSR